MSDASRSDRFIISLVRCLGNSLLSSLRYSVQNEGAFSALLEGKAPFVCAFWHGSMFYPWWKLRNRNAAALISQSRDGERLTQLLEAWKYRVVRGSSSKGSKEAMEAMRGLIRDGRVLCITPDGPRGPYHELKMGAVRVAQTMHVPLLFVSVAYKRCHRLHSWDRFEIPVPFSKAFISFSDPIIVDPTLNGEALETFRISIGKRMQEEYGHLLRMAEDL